MPSFLRLLSWGSFAWVPTEGFFVLFEVRSLVVFSTAEMSMFCQRHWAAVLPMWLVGWWHAQRGLRAGQRWGRLPFCVVLLGGCEKPQSKTRHFAASSLKSPKPNKSFSYVSGLLGSVLSLTVEIRAQNNVGKINYLFFFLFFFLNWLNKNSDRYYSAVTGFSSRPKAPKSAVISYQPLK